MSSQSKQQRVSPVRNRLPFSASMSFTLVRMAVIAFLLASSLFNSMCLNFEYTFSIFLFTSLSEMKRLCPPGMFFMMCLSIFSFSSTATPLSIKIGGWAASKFDLKSIFFFLQLGVAVSPAQVGGQPDLSSMFL